MGLFTKKIGPVFLKDTSDADNYIEKLQVLAQTATGNNAKKIEKQINFIKSGKYGESNVAYELKNSGMDMYILHDIYLEQGNQSAQIDYLVITRKRTYIIECKMLTGDIEIDNTGAFIRKYERSGKTIREGFYSPITQNQMHLQVVKEVWNNNKLNFFNRSKFERNFNDNFQSIIVLANPKTCINMEYAPKEIKEQVIRSDQLIAYIQKKDSISNNEMSNNDMLDAAQFYLRQHKPGRFDYAKKYEELVQNAKSQKSDNKASYIKHESEQTITTNTTVRTVSTLKNPFPEIKNVDDTSLLSYNLLMQIKQANNNTTQDVFFEKAACLWLQSTMAYLWFEANKDEQNIPTLLEILKADEVREDVENYKNAVDMLFEELEQKNKGHFAVKQRKAYKEAAGKNAKNVLDTLKAYFNLPPQTANVKNAKEKTIEKLKEFRLNQSRAEGIKPFYIFNNAQMEDLLSKMPRTKDELLKVSGFGATKVNKYGDEILKILWKYE